MRPAPHRSHQSRYLGRSERTATAGAFELGHWFVDVYGSEVEPHGHEEAHFMCAIGGAYSSGAEGERYAGGPELIFNPAGTWHGDRFESGGSFVSVTLTAADEEGLPSAPRRVDSVRSHMLVAALLRELADWAPESALSCEALCAELVGTAAGRITVDRRRPAWLDRACAVLRECGCDLSLSQMAARAGVHPYHLARTFRAFEGCTPGDYLFAVRLQAAARLLATTRAPLAEVAAASGFADQSHLTRRFRAAYGAPPGAYRRLAGG
jgi:AraC family transcriptional regulator